MHQLFNLTDYFFNWTAPFPATAVGDNAVGAEVITALNDGNKGAG